ESAVDRIYHRACVFTRRAGCFHRSCADEEKSPGYIADPVGEAAGRTEVARDDLSREQYARYPRASREALRIAQAARNGFDPMGRCAHENRRQWYCGAVRA